MLDQATKLRDLVGLTRSSGKRESGSPLFSPASSSYRLEPPGGKRFRSIAITSGKGGVGKSYTTLCLSMALSQLQKRVLVLDGDLGLANLHIMLGIAPKNTLTQAIRHQCSFGEVLCDLGNGVTLIPGSSGMLSPPRTDSFIRGELEREFTLLEPRFDFMLIDGGAGIGEASMKFCRAADAVFVILSPEPTSLADAYTTVKVLSMKGAEQISIIVNMARSEREGRDIHRKLNALAENFLKRKLKLLGILPYDGNIPKYIRLQKISFGTSSSSSFVTAVMEVARQICEERAAVDGRGSFISRIRGDL